MEETPHGEKVPYPFVSVLVLNWNGRSLLETCLPPLLNQDYPNYEVVVIDNASTDDSRAFVEKKFPQVRLVCHPENYGFSQGYNLVLGQNQADIVVLINSDVVTTLGCLRAVVQPIMADAAVGLVGGLLHFPDGTVQYAGAELTYPLAFSHHFHYKEPDTGQIQTMRDVDYVTGAVMAIPQRTLAQVGVFDALFVPFYYEEVDYCYRVRAAGLRVVAVPELLGVHDESTSMQQVVEQRVVWYQKNRLRFVLKHYTIKQILHDFGPAERAQLQEPGMRESFQLLRRVYLETAVSVPQLLQGKGDLAEVTAVQNLFLQLRQAAANEIASDYGLPVAGQQPSTLIQQADLIEPGFSSTVPVVGVLIAGFRRMWNSVSTKWVVRQLIQQQTRFNRLSARLLSELQKQNRNDAAEIHLLISELWQLQQQHERFAAETTDKLDRLQRQLTAIESLLKQNREGEKPR